MFITFIFTHSTAGACSRRSFFLWIAKTEPADNSGGGHLLPKYAAYFFGTLFVSDNSGCWYKTESAGEITAAVDASGQVEITFNKSA